MYYRYIKFKIYEAIFNILNIDQINSYRKFELLPKNAILRQQNYIFSQIWLHIVVNAYFSELTRFYSLPLNPHSLTTTSLIYITFYFECQMYWKRKNAQQMYETACSNSVKTHDTVACSHKSCTSQSHAHIIPCTYFESRNTPAPL